MEKWPKEKLIAEVSKQKEETKYVQNKLRDLVTAYKSLIKEKEALESGYHAFKNAYKADEQCSSQNLVDEKNEVPENLQKDDQKISSEVSMLMNSLTALSSEKSRMEASFQADKKNLRQEKDKYESMARELQDKFKSVTFDLTKEVEHLKSNLIIERHEREKEQKDYETLIRDLQSHLSKERDEKVYLELTLSELASKEEVDRFKEIDITEKFLNLQKKHLVVLEQERKKIQVLEIDFKDTERAYEQRVAGLENRIAELSTTLVKYNRNKQQDQNEIVKLRAHINELSSMITAPPILNDISTQTSLVDVLKDKSEAVVASHVKAIKDKLLYYENLLLNANEYCEKSLNIHTSNDEYQSCPSSSNTNQNIPEKVDVLRLQENKNELDNLKIKIRMLSDQNNILNEQLNDTINRYERQIDDLRKHQTLLGIKHEDELHTLHINYKAQIMELEIQVQKQRDRTLALIDEKEQEVTSLKSSFQMFVPGNTHSVMAEQLDECSVISQLSGVLAGTGKNSQENPHILHYAHELARRDVVINGLRKNCAQLESSLRDIKKELIMLKHSNMEQVANLNSQISRLESCQSREGANLEYLKNVIVNYLHTKNSSSKRHMLNAIAAVLQLTDSEMNKIKNKI